MGLYLSGSIRAAIIEWSKLVGERLLLPGMRSIVKILAAGIVTTEIDHPKLPVVE